MEAGNSFYHDEAEKIFRQAYEKQMKGELGEAINLYRKSIELYPSAEAHTFLGWAYSLQGHYREAIDECRRAIEIDPDFGNPYNDIGAYLIEQGKHDEAIEWLEKALAAKRYDSYCYPHYNLGRIYEKKGNWFRAFECYDNALRDNPEYTLAKQAMARLSGLMN